MSNETAPETAPGVNAFFESYRAAFERFDAPAIADHFAYPSHVTSDTGEIVLMAVAGRQDWIAQVERLIGMYRAIKVSSARVLDLVTTELSPRLIQARIHWALHDGAGRDLYDFDAIYTLASINGALRITAISHNEIPRYRACLARLQGQHTPGTS
jgi:hypothetical protein